MLHPMNAMQSAACAVFAATLMSAGDKAASPAAAPKATDATRFDCPTSIPLARLVSESDLIILAAPNVPVGRLRIAMTEDAPDYIDVPLSEPSFLKGNEKLSELVVRFYPKTTTYAPSPEVLLKRSGKPSLFFLTRVDEGPVGLYLAHSLDALQDVSPARTEAVKAEVRRQRDLAATQADNATPQHFDGVRVLLSKLPHATEEQQQDVFQKLEALGRDGVPAIVAQMDDRRPLAHSSISLVNHDPNAFEGLRHYGPELVVDALDAILNQITGAGGSVVNGGSERERQSAVSAWRVYVADMKCS